MSELQTMPVRDEACETVVMGTLLSYPRAWQENADLLSADLFANGRLQTVYNAAKAVADKGEQQVDIISVSAELDREGGAACGTNAPLVAEINGHGGLYYDLRPKLMRLQELCRRRKLWRIGQRLVQSGTNEAEPLEAVQTQAMDAISGLFVSASSSIKPIADIAVDFTADIVRGNRQGTHKVGIPTGFKLLDDGEPVLQLSDLVVIAAESSQGKTSFAINVAVSAAKKGCAVAVYSMEMTSEQLYARIMAAETGIPSGVLSARPLDDTQLGVYEAASNKVSRLPMFFDERATSSLESILSSVRTMVYRKRVRLVIVDYLQILNVNTKNANKEQVMANAARRFKNLARELNVCIVLLSQLSRDRDNPRPSQARIRDSGQIAESADVVMLIYRPEVYGTRYEYPEPYKNVRTDGTAMVEVSKGRKVGVRKFIVGFMPTLTKFYDLDQGSLPLRNIMGNASSDPDTVLPF